MTQKRDLRLYIASFLAVLLFFQFNYGLQIVIPTNVSWLMTVKTDWNTHYLGWFFYRNEPWHFPLGRMTNYFYPVGTNVGFTDSIPLLAIFFKIFSPLLPADFQYFGAWLVGCELLIAYFTIRICERFSIKPFLSFLVVLFITQNPVLIYRYMHPALCSHWLFLASIWLYFQDPAKTGVQRILLRQFLLLTLSAMLTPYLLVVEFGFTIVILAKLLFYDKALSPVKAFGWLAGSGLAIVILWGLVGLITFGKKEIFRVEGGYGLLSMNLNAFFDPWDWSSFLSARKRINILQYEGFMYLGVGIFLLLFVLLGYRIWLAMQKKTAALPRRGRLIVEGTPVIPLLVYAILLGLFAITNTLTFDDHVLVIPIPDAILKIGDIFRASGRFFWTTYYLILFVILFAVAKSRMPEMLKASILTVALVLQVYDLKFLLSYPHPSYGAYNPPIDPRWKKIMTHFDKVLFYPPFQTDYLERVDYQYFSFLAASVKKPIDVGYVARTDNGGVRAFGDSVELGLLTGHVDTQALYITTPAHLQKFALALDKLELHTMNGYYFLYGRRPADTSLQALAGAPSAVERKSMDSVLALMPAKVFFQPMEGLKPDTNKIAMAFGSQLEGDGYLYLNGWAYVNGKQNNKGDSIFACLAGTKTYIAPLRIYPRPDVTAAFKAAYLDDSGFEGGLFESTMDKGSYTLGMAIKDKEGKWVLQLTDKKIEVGSGK